MKKFNKSSFMEVSLKTGENLDESCEEIIRLMMLNLIF